MRRDDQKCGDDEESKVCQGPHQLVLKIERQRKRGRSLARARQSGGGSSCMNRPLLLLQSLILKANKGALMCRLLGERARIQDRRWTLL